MSRSYRKPCFRDNNRGGSKKAKMMAHRKLRRSQTECGQNSNYKKYYCQYDINDYKYVVWRRWEHTKLCGLCTPGEFEETKAIWEKDIKKAKRK